MPLKKSFDNVVTQEKEKKVKVTRLSELNKSDRDTIFNLIFSEVPEKKI